VTSGTLATWSLSYLDNGTYMPCPDGFVWSADSSMNCQWYRDTGRDWLKYQAVLIIIIV